MAVNRTGPKHIALCYFLVLGIIVYDKATIHYSGFQYFLIVLHIIKRYTVRVALEAVSSICFNCRYESQTQRNAFAEADLLLTVWPARQQLWGRNGKC